METIMNAENIYLAKNRQNEVVVQKVQQKKLS